MNQRLIHELRHLLGEGQVITDRGELAVFDCDGFTIARSVPGAVVFPLSTEQTAGVVKLLAREGAQIVPRGSGTGLAGGCVGFENGIVVSTARMNRILEIDLPNRIAQVEAGVRNLALSEAVAEAQGRAVSTPLILEETPASLHFAPDPSSQRVSTIGGNASTNAGGIHTLKDFVTSNHILGLEMVLGDGQIIQLGATNGQYESGPFDLPGLVCGSEGTLGLITRLWVRLVPRASAFRTMVAAFPSTRDACEAVSDIIAAGHLPSAMEMLDGFMIRNTESVFKFGLPTEAAAMLLIEIDGVEPLLDGQLQAIIELIRKNRGYRIDHSADPDRRAELWKMRKHAFGAIGRVSESYCTQDACIPRSRLAEALEAISKIGQKSGMTISNVFHAGDGNIHPIFLYDDRDKQQMQTVLSVAHEVLEYCLSIGGTITGEHGVGVEKIDLIPRQFDPATLRQLKRVKEAFDPGEQFNAGKLLPSEKVNIRLLG